MIDPKMEKEINEQINRELYSAYLYYAMAADFNDKNLSGFANWLEVQAKEEIFHASKFFNYLFERGGRATLLPIEGPPAKWKSPLAAFEAAYKHEQFITDHIHKLVALAEKLKDYASHEFLQWYVAEQVEEEASADEIVQKLKLVKDAPGGLFMLDRELGARTFTAPSSEGD